MNAIYSLVFASLMLTVGRFGDLYGRKRLFALGWSSSWWRACSRAPR